MEPLLHQSSRQVQRHDDALIRFAILRACDPACDLDVMRERVQDDLGLLITNRSLANMAAVLHRYGFLRYRSEDGLRYGNWHWLTKSGRAVTRYFGGAVGS